MFSGKTRPAEMMPTLYFTIFLMPLQENVQYKFWIRVISFCSTFVLKKKKEREKKKGIKIKLDAN